MTRPHAKHIPRLRDELMDVRVELTGAGSFCAVDIPDEYRKILNVLPLSHRFPACRNIVSTTFCFHTAAIWISPASTTSNNFPLREPGYVFTAAARLGGTLAHDKHLRLHPRQRADRVLVLVPRIATAPTGCPFLMQMTARSSTLGSTRREDPGAADANSRQVRGGSMSRSRS